MKMFIFRHGIAMDRDEAAKHKLSDPARPLTEKGKARTLKMAQYLLSQEKEIDAIITSPYVRARDTAKIIAGVFGLSKKIIETGELVPSAPPQAFQLWLKKNAGTLTRVIVVGHEPHLSTFCCWATAGTTIGFLDLKKSGIVSLELESLSEIHERSAQINWIVQPSTVLKKN